jgi:hypothetical protein
MSSDQPVTEREDRARSGHGSQEALENKAALTDGDDFAPGFDSTTMTRLPPTEVRAERPPPRLRKVWENLPRRRLPAATGDATARESPRVDELSPTLVEERCGPPPPLPSLHSDALVNGAYRPLATSMITTLLLLLICLTRRQHKRGLTIPRPAGPRYWWSGFGDVFLSRNDLIFRH